MDKPLDRLKQKKAAAAQKAQDDGRAGMIVNAVQSSGKDSQSEVTTAIHDLMMATLVGKDPRMVEISKTLSELLTQLSESSDKLSKSNLNELPKVQAQIVDALKAIPETIAAADRSPDLIPHLQKIVQAVQGKDTTPMVNVAAPNLDPILKAIRDIKFPAAEKSKAVDITPLQSSMKAVEDAINSLRFPVANYVLPFKDINGKDTQVTLDASGNVPTSGGAGGGGTQYTDGAATPAHPTVNAQGLNVSGTWLTETGTNVNGTTPSANVFLMNNTAGSPLGRVNLIDVTNSNVQGVSAAGGASINTIQIAGGTISTTGVTGQQKVGIVDSLGNSTNSAGGGFLTTSDEPRQTFYDPFDAAPDTVNMWTSTTGSSGVAASVTTGVLSMGTGTVANGYSKFTSIPTFKPTIPGWVVYSDAIQVPDAASPTANALRLWGVGTTPATPTFAAPATDGYFFQLSGSTLSAVVYAGGTPTVIATGLTLSTGYVRYIIKVRTDRTFFFINTIDSAGLVATTNFQSPQIQTLPKLFLAVGNSTPPGSNSQIQCTGAVVSDTGKNATLLADSTFPWRRAAVTSDGSQAVTPKSTTATPTSVAGSATSVQLLAANTARKGVTIYNDSTAILYLKLGTTASTTSYNLQMVALSYYELPFGYTGRIDGIWASAAGNARISELV